MAYTTLDKLKSELKGTESLKPTGTDQILIEIIRRITNRVRRIGYEFEPQFQTNYITATNEVVSSSWGTLNLKPLQLLEVKTLTSEGNSLSFGTKTSDVIPYPNGVITPYQVLRIRAPFSGSTIWTWYPINLQNQIESIAITGWWGFRTYYAAQGWLDSNSTLASSLTASGTSISTQNVGSTDPLGETPRFSPGNLIRIDDEMMEVVATDTTLNTLTVLRGVNGTGPGVTHSSAAPILWWNIEPDLQGAVTRQCALWYSRRGAFDQVQINDVATVVFPPDLETQLINTVRYIVGSV